eukprot:2398806-Lingulodinium_polyedra.AAC.1
MRVDVHQPMGLLRRSNASHKGLHSSRVPNGVGVVAPRPPARAPARGSARLELGPHDDHPVVTLPQER